MTRRIRAYVPFVVVTAIALGAALLTANPTGLQADLTDLGSKIPSVRKSAIDKLSKGSGTVRALLLDELDSDRSALTKASIAVVVKTLGVTNSNASVLKTCLESRDAATRHAAIGILATTKRGDLARISLGRILSDTGEAAALRCGAAIALGSGGPSARDALLDAVRDEKAPSSVTSAAMRALAACSDKGAKDIKGIVDDAKADQGRREEAVRALAADGSKGPDLLKVTAASPTAWLRQSAIEALASTGQNSYAATIAPALADPVASVRLAALRGVIDTKGEKTYRAGIAALFADADARVRGLAARSVGRSSGDIAANVQAVLLALLGDASFHVRYEAALALLAHGNKGGLATMQADAVSLNQSQAAQARHAAARIQGLK